MVGNRRISAAASHQLDTQVSSDRLVTRLSPAPNGCFRLVDDQYWREDDADSSGDEGDGMLNGRARRGKVTGHWRMWIHIFILFLLTRHNVCLPRTPLDINI